MSQDPLGLDGGFHRFTYAENRPTTLVDPEGLTAVELGALDQVGGVGWGARPP